MRCAFKFRKFFTNILSFLIVLLMMLNKQNSYAQQPDTIYYIPVKHEQQEMTLWCWAAVRSMISNTTNKYTTQCREASLNAKFQPHDCCIDSDICNESCTIWFNNKIGVESLSKSIDTLKKIILGNRELCVSQIGSDGAGRHYYITSGFLHSHSSNWLLINDPLIDCPSLISETYYGSGFGYDLKSCWSVKKVDLQNASFRNLHSAKIFINSVFILNPIEQTMNKWVSAFLLNTDRTLLNYLKIPEVENSLITDSNNLKLFSADLLLLKETTRLNEGNISKNFNTDVVSENGRFKLYVIQLSDSLVCQLICKQSGDSLQIQEIGYNLVNSINGYPTRDPNQYDIIVYYPKIKGYLQFSYNTSLNYKTVKYENKTYDLNDANLSNEFFHKIK